MIRRCTECGSWEAQCDSETPVPGCGCVRCRSFEMARLAAECDGLRAKVAALEGNDQSLRSKLSSQCQLTNEARAKALEEAAKVVEDTDGVVFGYVIEGVAPGHGCDQFIDTRATLGNAARAIRALAAPASRYGEERSEP